MTVLVFAVLGLGACGVVWALHRHDLALFLVAFLVLFVASGAGNGSTFRMISAGFRLRAPRDTPEALRAAARYTASCIGIASALGAYGGFLVPRGLALSASRFDSLVPAFLAFVGFYVVCGVLTWACYLRPRSGSFPEGV